MTEILETNGGVAADRLATHAFRRRIGLEVVLERYPTLGGVSERVASLWAHCCMWQRDPRTRPSGHEWIGEPAIDLEQVRQ